MNNDPCMYHVSFLLIVGDKDEGKRWREKSEAGVRPGWSDGGQAETEERGGETGNMERMASGIEGRDTSGAQPEERMP